jgi:glycosyltransferase involved in cell wall biosynthesis
LRILLLNNLYKQQGGEEIVAQAEQRLLKENGHQVQLLGADNREISGPVEILKSAALAAYSPRSRRRVTDEIARFNPDIVHVHNFFPLLSPSIYFACKTAGIPVIQTVHNYRLLCPNAFFFRDGKICEECLGRSVTWPGILHGCYRNSRPATLAVSAMLATHHLLGTWANYVDAYIVLTAFARDKFIEGGFVPEKLVVKPNFVHPDPGRAEVDRKYAIFVGRLSTEKGICTLLKAWTRLGNRVPLRIVGDGPLRKQIEAEASRLGLTCVSFLGQLSRDKVITAIQRARCLVFPSEWYEGFPLTIVEAFACGTPVICSRMGAMQEIVTNGVTGVHYNSGSAIDLAEKVEWAWTHTTETAVMGRNARQDYESKYTAERNYSILLEIYRSVIDRHAASFADAEREMHPKYSPK